MESVSTKTIKHQIINYHLNIVPQMKGTLISMSQDGGSLIPKSAAIKAQCVSTDFSHTDLIIPNATGWIYSPDRHGFVHGTGE
jgi:hypothetical protein